MAMAILGLFLGLVLSFLIWKSWSIGKASSKNGRSFERENISLESRVQVISEERERLVQDKAILMERVVELERQTSAVENDKKNLQERIQTHQEDLQKLQGQLSTHFENLAGKILEQNTKKFSEHSEKNISTLLGPLKERIQDFQKKVEETYSHEARERFALKKEIEKIVEANQQITRETHNLTQALRGDVKAQGNWGEMILEKILEASGLRQGQEYIVQGKDLGLVNQEGKRLKPDVIINLPDDKHIIIDSKVSLTLHFKQYLDSLYGHIDDLSAKEYQDLEQLDSPNFVLMFVPIEGAFSLAVQADDQLFSYAWERHIVIVSPTTLLATLRTVASLWKQERQNRNAQEIARQGGLLYDKFVGFLGDLERIGEALNKSQTAYSEAINKLQHGRGNILTKIEKLKDLGAKTSKSLPTPFIPSEMEDNAAESPKQLREQRS